MVSLKRRASRLEKNIYNALELLEYTGSYGRKNPTIVYEKGPIRVEQDEDFIFTYTEAITVYYNDDAIASGVYSGDFAPCEPKALFLPALIRELVGGIPVELALERYNNRQSKVTVEKMIAAGIRAEGLGVCSFIG